MRSERLTILTPTFNSLDFCESWCESIGKWCNELRKDVKFIIVDNLSQDGTLDYLKRNIPCSAEFFSIRSSVEEALHFGMSQVESPYTTMLSLDDRLFESYVLESINALSRYADCSLAFGFSYMQPVDKTGASISEPIRRNCRYCVAGRYKGNPLQTYLNNYPNDNMIVRTSCFKKIGGWARTSMSSINRGMVLRPFAPLLTAVGNIFYTDLPAYASGKHSEQYSKRMAANGQYADLWSSWFYDLSSCDLLTTPQRTAVRHLFISQSDAGYLDRYLTGAASPRLPYFTNRDKSEVLSVAYEIFVAALGEYQPIVGELNISEPNVKAPLMSRPKMLALARVLSEQYNLDSIDFAGVCNEY